MEIPRQNYVIITGGTGYIGSHCCIALIQQGYDVVLIDNLRNSSADVLQKICEITGVTPAFYYVDLLNYGELLQVFEEYKNKIHCVLHCAAFKSVSESVHNPLQYYDNNVNGTLKLLKAMKVAGCKHIVFSSSCTVYGNAEVVPITEDSCVAPVNPYGRTKLYVEEMLRDLANADEEWRVCILRYFNPVGAHVSGKIGENPKGIPTNLVPYILRVMSGLEEKLVVYGGDYDTKDGTCIRDYIHVMDLARGHVMAIDKICDMSNQVETLNLGTGIGYSVFEVIDMMQKVSGKNIKYVIGARRDGDSVECYAGTDKAYEVLGWKAEKGLQEMCEDSWRWHEHKII